MTENQKLNKILFAIKPFFNKGQWILNGSAVMVLYGINPRPMGDVDIFCTTSDWFRNYNDRESRGWSLFITDQYDERRRCDPPFLYKTIEGYRVDVFHTWRIRDNGNLDINKLIASQHIYGGWPCCPLQFILNWKNEIKREKDIVDIQALEMAIANE